MNRLIFLFLLLAVPAAAMAQAPQTADGVDPRIRTIEYDAGQVFRVRVATGYQLTIIFSPEERVENVGIGDSDGWQVTLNSQGDALFLKPVRLNGATNMTVITDARVYNFELSAAHAPGADTPFTIRFLHSDRAVATPTAPARLQVGRYRLTGARELRPAEISDDGVRTYIEWGARQAIPAVFAIDDQGDELLMDGHVRDGLFVIDAVHRTLLFRLDRQTARASRNRVRPGE